MTEDANRSDIRVTDRRHFDLSGERRKPEGPAEGAAVPPASPAAATEAAPPAPEPPPPPREERPASGIGDLSAGLASGFGLLVARLAQETEIYLGLVPYPGQETSEPDLEAARAMIDMLAMLQEKTRGNLDAQETRLLEDLLYTYRLEFVRRRSGGGAR